MYGLETAQLNDSHTNRLEIFQMKGYRKILGYKTTWGWMQGQFRELELEDEGRAPTGRKDKFRTKEDIMKEINEIMEGQQSGKPELLLGKFYQNAKHKRLCRILNMEKHHPVRYSTFNPDTNAEWNFKDKRRSGVKIRWEREIIRDIWEKIRWDLKGEEAVVGATQYITNTVGITEAKVAKNNAAIIAIIEKQTRQEQTRMQYEKAWHSVRKGIKELYSNKDEYGKIAKLQFNQGTQYENDMMAWLIEMYYPGIRNGTNYEWNEIWEDIKDRKALGKHKKRNKKPTQIDQQQAETEQYMYTNTCFDNTGKLILLTWASQAKNIEKQIYGSEAKNKWIEDIVKAIMQENDWKEEDDRTGEHERWERKCKNTEEEETEFETKAVKERLRIIKSIAVYKIATDNTKKCTTDEEVEEEIRDEIQQVINEINGSAAPVNTEQEETNEHSKTNDRRNWKAKTIEQYNKYHGDKPLTGSKFKWNQYGNAKKTSGEKI